MDSLPRLYRFALLLRGNPQAAAEALAGVFQQFDSQLGQLRHEKQRCAFVVRKLREQAAPSVSSSEDSGQPKELSELLERFPALPEPSRSALALFYAELFPAQDAADLLTMSLEEYSQALTTGRTLLAGSPPLAS